MDESTTASFSLTALRAFDTFCCTGSLKGAAERLGVTTGAVCRQLDRLARSMQPSPLEKRGGRLRLTPHGQTFATAVRAAFARLEAACAEYVAAAPADADAAADHESSPPQTSTPLDPSSNANRNLRSAHRANETANAA